MHGLWLGGWLLVWAPSLRHPELRGARITDCLSNTCFHRCDYLFQESLSHGVHLFYCLGSLHQSYHQQMYNSERMWDPGRYPFGSYCRSMHPEERKTWKDSTLARQHAEGQQISTLELEIPFLFLIKHMKLGKCTGLSFLIYKVGIRIEHIL